ncbi:hypothetical protein AK95_30305 [Paenibacillus sp. LC231]|nr:hypothetical protein AK95_30305 [Paenibacillus sp. LC231]
MYKETVPLVKGGGSHFHLTEKRFLFVCLTYIFAQRSGEDETIPDKRERSPLSPNFFLAFKPFQEIWGQQRWEERFVHGASPNRKRGIPRYLRSFGTHPFVYHGKDAI